MHYATPQLAAYACDHFNDFEYPIGYPISMRLVIGDRGGRGGDYMAGDRGGAAGGGQMDVAAMIEQIQSMRGVSNAPNLVSALKQVCVLKRRVRKTEKLKITYR